MNKVKRIFVELKACKKALQLLPPPIINKKSGVLLICYCQ